MKQAVAAVREAPFVMRCHRAFLVNLQTVTKVTGNLQGYQLQLGDTGREVPVSRGYAKEIRERLTL
jgi:DNA-binding LytR/AlgR family response regulator